MADHFKSHFSCLLRISIRRQSPNLLWPLWLVAHVICKIEIRRVTFFKSQDRERKVLIKAVNHDLVYSPRPTHTNQISSGRDHTTHKGCCWSCKLESFTKLKEVQSHFGGWVLYFYFYFFSRFCLYLCAHIELLHCRLKCYDDNLSRSFHASLLFIYFNLLLFYLFIFSSQMGHV